MRLSLFIISAFIFSCTSQGSNMLSSSDSLAIQFDLSNDDNPVKTMGTTNQVAIKKVANFLNEEPSMHPECNVNCKLLFYKKNVLTHTVWFNYTDDCKSFHIIDSNGAKPIRMSDEATDFLKRLAEGKSWY